MKQVFTVVAMLLLSMGCVNQERGEQHTVNQTPGMQFIPGGSFTMGSNSPGYPAEGPAHTVAVSDFYMDKTEVTNVEFSEFVVRTGYVTTAEIVPTWEELKTQLPPGTPKPDVPLSAGSVVYFQPEEPVTSMQDFSLWWRWVEGANWKNPEGPGSDLENRWDHPVVHVSLKDAQAYCEWKGKRLPTEAEWEYASRGGKDGLMFSWGDELQPDGKFMANTYQGAFPVRNLALDGFGGTSPVKAFPPNDYGLYDMIGNVWEWTSDYYDAGYYATLADKSVENPKGSAKSFDPQDPFAKKYVIKGGSYLCAENYCSNYRPSARQGASFDSGASNIGFRCVRNP